MDCVASGRIDLLTDIRLIAPVGTKGQARNIDVVNRVMVIGPRKCRGLLGLANFMGKDWGGKWAGKTTKTWTEAYLKLDENDPIVEVC